MQGLQCAVPCGRRGGAARGGISASPCGSTGGGHEQPERGGGVRECLPPGACAPCALGTCCAGLTGGVPPDPSTLPRGPTITGASPRVLLLMVAPPKLTARSGPGCPSGAPARSRATRLQPRLLQRLRLCRRPSPSPRRCGRRPRPCLLTRACGPHGRRRPRLQRPLRRMRQCHRLRRWWSGPRPS
jgi:hypothetical protein